jgi:hypothetical protein
MKRALAVALTVAAVVLAVPEPALAADSSYRTLTTASNPDWMRSVPDSASLASLSVPGTHQSMSIIGGSLTQTQENYGNSGGSLRAQLMAGIRAIDIRARVNSGNTFTIHHGAQYQNANFTDVLNVLETFLREHPSETVIMRFKQECHGGLGSCTDVAGQRSFPDIFEGYKRPLFWGPSADRATSAPTPALGQVRGKVVLAVMHGAGGSPIERYGLSQFQTWRDGNSAYVQDSYNVPNVGAIATKRDQVRRFLDATSAGERDKIYVNHGSGSSIWAHPQSVAGGAFGVQGVNPFLLTYLNEGHGITRTGIVMLDFPGGGLINRIIAVNG